VTHSATKSAGRERLARVGLPPRGLDRLEAAAYVGVAPGTFDAMVKDKQMPQPKQSRGRLVWDRLELDRAFDLLPHVGGGMQLDDADDEMRVAL
jgi:predicted DNA-binding transcriptional regulator AlpA